MRPNYLGATHADHPIRRFSAQALCAELFAAAVLIALMLLEKRQDVPGLSDPYCKAIKVMAN